jgi:hypothetical protein
LVGKFQGKDHLLELGVGGRIIMKWIFWVSHGFIVIKIIDIVEDASSRVEAASSSKMSVIFTALTCCGTRYMSVDCHENLKSVALMNLHVL